MIEHLVISPFGAGDEPELFSAYVAVVEEGGAFPRRPPVDRRTFRSAWLDGASGVQVARLGGALVGSYFIKPCFPGLAAHIANAGYLVVKEHRRCGIGRRLAEHSLIDARRHGFDAMMFNLVLERNPSRRLWESLGFIRVGAIPDAVDGEAALIYWRSLLDSPPTQGRGRGSTHPEIRLAHRQDAEALAAIFDEAVQAGDGTFETRIPSIDEFAQSIASQLTIVAVIRETVVGWARLGPYMPARAGIGLYQLYVTRSHRGEGIGKQLLAELARRAEIVGYFKIVGRVFVSNAAAIRVAGDCGFRQVGVHQRHGQVYGEWQDVAVFERLLGPAAR